MTHKPQSKKGPSLLPGTILMLLAGLLLAGLLPALLLAQDTEGGVKVERRINWGAGQMVLDLTSRLPNTNQALPAGRYYTEQQITKELPVITREQLLDIPIDSWYTINTFLEERRPELFRPLEELYQVLVKRYAKATPDLREITIRYRLNLYPEVIDLFIDHETPRDPPRLLEYEPTKEFSGIVIYAKGELPLHGSRDVGTLQPCFFPRLYDEDMHLILDKEMLAPDTLRRWGTAAYSQGLEEKPFRHRIAETGKEPLYIMARGLFGKNRTDLIIPNDDARKILALDANRRLLQEGRILIIY